MTNEDKKQPKPKSTAKATKPARKGSTSTKRVSKAKAVPKKAAKAPAVKAATKTKVAVPSEPRLKTRQASQVAPQLVEEFGYSSVMQVPKLEKIVLNIGLGEALDNSKAIENATGDLTKISGQKPVTTLARKSIAAFKIREGMPIGVSVTLRGFRMYEFLDRLMNASLPRVRDFRGVSRKSFDGRGNFSLGLREQVIFPEIDYNNIDKLRGLQIVVVTTAKTDREGERLLELLGMPFERMQEESAAS